MCCCLRLQITWVMMKKTFFVLIVTLLSVPSFAQSREDRRAAQAAAVMNMLNDTTYTIHVATALPMGWRTVNLSSYYSLEVAKDTVISCLPYFGRAYSVPYGGGKGLVFDGKAEDYRMTENKDGGREITFSVMNEEDKYRFSLSVYPGGSAYISVNSGKRQPISYTGRVSLGKKE